MDPGTLDITAPNEDGVAAQDSLIVTGGSYTVEAAGHGLACWESFRAADGDLTIASGKRWHPGGGYRIRYNK